MKIQTKKHRYKYLPPCKPKIDYLDLVCFSTDTENVFRLWNSKIYSDLFLFSYYIL